MQQQFESGIIFYKNEGDETMNPYDHPCEYELTKEERSLLTCATGLLYKKKHYRNYLYLPKGYVDNLIHLGLVDKECREVQDNNVYYYLTEEGIRTAYKINGLRFVEGSRTK